MKNAHEQLVAIQRMGAQEYADTDLASGHAGVTRRVRRDRTVRASVATLAGVGIVGAGAFGVLQLRGADALVPMNTPSPSVTGTSPSPSESAPTPTVTAPVPVDNEVTVEAGDRADEVIDRLADAYGVSADEVAEAIEPRLPQSAQGDIEGWLYPDTYDTGEMTLDELTAQMVSRQAIEVSKLDEDQAQWQEIVTIASIAQAEAINAADMAGVAAVVRNRLDEGMQLQIDSPLFYYADINGLEPSDDGWDIDTPYNTFRYDGLPPTPINSPGADAIGAAAQTVNEDWLYFARDDSTRELQFATTFREYQEILVDLGKLEPEDVL